MLDFKTETFLCVCRHRNLTRAAEELHLTQPAVTQQMHLLEKYYGVRLFRYSGHTLSLTREGEYLRSRLEAMYHDTQRMKETLAEMDAAPRFSIGTTMSAGGYVLPQYLARYLARHPRAQLTVTQMDTKDILRLLNAGTLDFAFVEGYVRRDLYAVTELRRDEVVLVCGARCGARRCRTADELLAYPLLLREAGSGTREILEAWLREHGLTAECFPLRSEFSSPTMIRRLLCEGFGVSALYRSVVQDALEAGTLAEIPAEGFPLPHAYSAVWRRESLYADTYQAAIREMIEAVRSCDSPVP